MLTVERVFALRNANMEGETKGNCTLTQSKRDVKVADGRKLNWSILSACAFMSDCSRGDNQITRVNIQMDTAAGPNADKSGNPDSCKFLHCNAGRRTADTGGSDTDRLTIKITCPGVELSILRQMSGFIKTARNRLTSSRITRQNTVFSDLALCNINVLLTFH
jgi:hypothetical protein